MPTGSGTAGALLASYGVRPVKQAVDVSHWLAQLYPDGPVPQRAALQQSREADVCVVGAGYGGLWFALELKRAAPERDVVVLEAVVSGYGAAGRNGGAVIAQMNGSRRYWARRGGRDGAIAIERAVQTTVDEIGQAIEREGIDCWYGKNGYLAVARNELELDRFRATVEEDRAWGFGLDDSRILDAKETAERIAVAGAVGARFSPHCASIDPGRLVRGLADAAERAGVTIYEGTPVDSIAPGAARTPNGTVRARNVVVATEAYTESIATERGRVIPVCTSMLVTEQIPESTMSEIGWRGHEALLAEHPFLHLQHTADGRITIGGDDNRVPYRYGSRASADGPVSRRIEERYRKQLIRLFPALREVRIEQSWQGSFGATRTWAPGVWLDRKTGLAWLGGYVGEGVAGSNLAARTLRDLMLGESTELTRLPWVGNRPRRFEPEPLRFAAANLIWALRYGGEELEHRTGRGNPFPTLGNRLAGFTGHLG